MKQTGRQKEPFFINSCSQVDCPLDTHFRHSLSHENRLCFGVAERGGGFDEIKSGGGEILCDSTLGNVVEQSD